MASSPSSTSSSPAPSSSPSPLLCGAFGGQLSDKLERHRRQPRHGSRSDRFRGEGNLPPDRGLVHEALTATPTRRPRRRRPRTRPGRCRSSSHARASASVVLGNFLSVKQPRRSGSPADGARRRALSRHLPATSRHRRCRLRRPTDPTKSVTGAGHRDRLAARVSRSFPTRAPETITRDGDHAMRRLTERQIATTPASPRSS